MLHVLFAVTLLASTPAPAVPVAATYPPALQQCSYIARWRLENVPPAAHPRPSTDIVHAVVVYAPDGWAIGWLAFVRSGKAWYFDGPVRQPYPPLQYSEKALRALGFSYKHRSGQMIPLKKVDVSGLVNSGLRLRSCY